MQLEDKLAILADSAKYDVACTSSGVDRAGVHGKLGCSVAAGICHSFTPDGRCISLLKVLYSNACCYDCGYCVNRRSNDVPRATFTPRELAELTIGFYKRNYIEGLFLSSAVIGTPDYTMERMIEALRILRQEYHFNGYIHAKTIPGADAELVRRIGLLADRLSVNIELPSEASLSLLAPDKKKQAILKPMGQIAVQSAQSKKELVLYRHAPAFAPAGQSTQMIIGATPESDRHIMGLAESLYKKYSLKRVFFSAYLPVNSDSRLPALDVRPPLLREHRLYQADWLLRYYDFSAWELLTEEEPNFDPYLDPKCTWAVRHPEFFPVEINTAPKAALLRIPGIGPKSALRILSARRQQHLGMAELKRMGVVLKRAQYFITCNGSMVTDRSDHILRAAPLPLPTTLEILDYLGSMKELVVQLYADQKMYITRTDWERREVIHLPAFHLKALFSDDESVVESLSERARRPHSHVEKINLPYLLPKQKSEIKAWLAQRYGDRVRAVSTMECNLELTDRDGSKGAALGALCDSLHIPTEQAMALGDAGNDIGMLQTAGIGVAMSNAIPEVQAAADWITLSNEEDGVAHAIHSLLGI